MARYRSTDVWRVLLSQQFEIEGDTSATAIGVFTPQGHAFLIPVSSSGYVVAEVLEQILADRWVPADFLVGLERLPD